MEDYQVFEIPKRRGGKRIIEASNDELKQKQRTSMLKLKWQLRVSPFAHAFSYGKNIATMATPHINKPFVLAFDLKDFFPSVKHEQFEKLLEDHCGKKKKGWPERLKKLKEEVKVHFHDFDDDKGLRLPQGAPGSPLLSNAFLYRFDWRMAWSAYSQNICYTRYADDLVFSGEQEKEVWTMFYIARNILKTDTYKLNVHPKKIKMMHRGRRQMVCGCVVNEKLNLPRRWRKKLRAALHQEGLYAEGLREAPKDHGRILLGKRSFKNMVDNPLKTKNNLDVCSLMDMINKL